MSFSDFFRLANVSFIIFCQPRSTSNLVFSIDPNYLEILVDEFVAIATSFLAHDWVGPHHLGVLVVETIEWNGRNFVQLDHSNFFKICGR